MSAPRVAQAAAIAATMLGIAAAAFWLPTLDYRDMLAGTPEQAAALRALARRECGLLMPIRRIFAPADGELASFSCRAPFGFQQGGAVVLRDRIAWDELNPRLGIRPWLAFLALEGAWGALLCRAFRPRP